MYPLTMYRWYSASKANVKWSKSMVSLYIFCFQLRSISDNRENSRDFTTNINTVLDLEKRRGDPLRVLIILIKTIKVFLYCLVIYLSFV